MEEEKWYVIIDCLPERELFKNAAAVVISNEFMKSNFAGEDTKVLFIRYAENASGLVIFTFGTREILFGRKGSKVCQFNPYKVEVKSTLSAGDTFRAGVVYGLLNDWDDEKTVAFAAATAASVCTRFPMVFDPPSLEEVF